MPRRYADYLPERRLHRAEPISSVGAFLLGASTLPFLYNVWKTWRTRAEGRDRRPVGLRPLPGVGDVLPAAAAQLRVDCPRIRSEWPAFDLHHPEVAALDTPSPDQGTLERLFGEPHINDGPQKRS